MARLIKHLGDNMDNVLQRAMFQGQRPQPMQADGTGITSGLADTAEAMEEVGTKIDNAEDYAGVMDALRGDEASIEERRTELAGYVGRKDATKTPDSVLTLLQPTFSILEMAENEAPEGGINMGMMQAPRQQEAMARMAMGEQPVMRQDGSTEGGETVPAGFNIDAYKQIMGMVPEPTSYESYLKQYQDLLGSDQTGYEYAPYISGLQLAAAVANAPEGGLLSSILAPQTISAVADPILQMAQAKGKQEQAIKLKAAEAASKSQAASQEAKTEMLKTFATEALKTPDLKIFGSDALGQYAVDPRNPNQITTLVEGLGRKQTPFGDATIGYYLLNDDGTTTTLQQGLGRKPDIFGNAEAGFFYLDENNSVVTAKAGAGPDKQIYGNAEFGFYTYNPADGTSSVLQAGQGPEAPEFVQLIERFNDQKAIVDNPASTPDAIAKAKQELTFLSGKLTPSPQGTEFERLLQAGKDTVYAQTEGTEAEKLAAANKFEANALEGYITAKTTPNLQYNPRKSIDDVFAKMLGEDIAAINANVASTQDLKNFANQAAQASEGFETGALAGTRLRIQKFVKAIPGLDTFIKEGMSPENYAVIMGGDPVQGELAERASNQFALRMSQFIPGNLNVEELQMVQKAGPSLYTTPEGLQVLSQIYDAAADRAIKEQQFVTDWMQTNSQKYPNAEDKYIALNQARSNWLSENPVVDSEIIANLPKAPIGGEITAQRTVGEGTERETQTVRLNQDTNTLARFISQYDTKEQFKANVGGLVQLGVLKDKDNRVITTNPTDADMDRLWGIYSGFQFEEQ